MLRRPPYLGGVFFLRVDDGQLVVPWSGFQLASPIDRLPVRFKSRGRHGFIVSIYLVFHTCMVPSVIPLCRDEVLRNIPPQQNELLIISFGNAVLWQCWKHTLTGHQNLWYDPNTVHLGSGAR